MTHTDAETDRFVTGAECYRMVGLGRITVKRWEDAGRFPQRVQLGRNRVAWKLSDLTNWMENPATWAERQAKASQAA